MSITATRLAASSTFTVSAIDRRNPGEDFLPEGKVIQVSISTHILDGGIISSSDTALSIEETINLIERLSKALEKATSLGL
jgi:hypothetical protein